MTETTTKTRERISATLENLPSPPFVALEVLRITNDPEASVISLAGVISQDPVLSARLLKVANSPTFGAGREVTTIERATMLLGLKAVKLLALSFSLAPDASVPPVGLNFDEYWYHSLLNAVTARYWAGLVDRRVSDESFLAGLMSHLGRLILANHTKERYLEVTADGRSWPSPADEERVFGFSGASVTDQVLHEWGLPSLISDCAGAMYLGGLPPEMIDESRRSLGRVLEMTVLTERVLASADTDAFVELERLAGEVGVGPADLQDVLLHFEASVRELAHTFEVVLPSDMSHATMLDLARTALVNVSMDAVANLNRVEAENDELETRAFQDKLTGIANRAMFDDHLEREINHAMRSDPAVLGLIVVDIDHFKNFNDTYGHQTGDLVLHDVAQTLQTVVRRNELLARYGGEEFTLVIRDCTPEALAIAGERLRLAVEGLTVESEHGPLRVTISVGAACDVVRRADDGDRLVKEADAALYIAKESGRNRVHIAS